MKHQSFRLQNMVSILVTALLVAQTLLLILVLFNLKVIRQTMATEVIPQSDPSASLIGTQAPDFTLPDEEGQLVTLSEYKEHLVLLVFTSHTCPFCREMYPGLRQFLDSNPDIQVIVLSMNTASENQMFREEFNLTNYANLRVLSATREVVEKYLIRGTPTFIVIDKDRVIMNTGYAITAEQISGLISK